MTEILVADWEATVLWYVETLGLRLEMTDPTRRFALLAAGPGRVALKGVGRDPAGLSDPRRAGGVRLVFRVDDVDAEYERLRGHGAEVSEPADHPREPYREVRLTDPDGNPIILFAWRERPDSPDGSAPG